jgi:hypothetical protein
MSSLPSQASVIAGITQMFAQEGGAAATSQPASPAAVPVAQPPVAAPVVPPQPTQVAVPQVPQPAEAPLQAPSTPPAQSPAPAPTTEQAAPTLEQQQAVAANAINDQALYNVPQADGTVAMMSGKELRESVLRQSDYTRKTQALAKQRQELDAVIPQYQQATSELARLRADLGDPRAVARFVMEQYGPQFVQQLYQHVTGTPQGQPQAVPAVQPPATPEELASQGYVSQQTAAVTAQIQQLQQQLVAIQQQTAQQVQAAQQAAEQAEQRAVSRVETRGYQQVIEAELPRILDENPLLKAVPNSSDLLRYEVLRTYRPQTVQEAVQCFRLEAQKMSAGILAAYQAQQKTQLVAQQQQQQALTQNGLATAGGGTPLTVQPQTGPQYFLTPDGKGDWGAMRQGAEAFLRAEFARQ